MNVSLDPVRGPIASAALASVILVGCQDPETAPPPTGDEESVVADSAGVTIVENPGGMIERVPHWQVAEEPELEIGELEGADPYQFGRIVGVEALSDGSLAVLDYGSWELRIFDRDGSHRLTAGGEGDAPGEFRFPGSLTRLAGDSLLVGDGQRLTVFSPDGQYARSIPWPRGDVLGLVTDSVAVDLTAHVEGGGGPPTSDEPEALHRDWSLLLLDLSAGDGEAPDTVQGTRSRDLQASWTDGGTPYRASVPIPASPHAAVRHGRISFVDGNVPEIRFFDRNGELDRIARVPSLEETLTEGKFDELVNELDAGTPFDMRLLFRAVDNPGLRPVFTDLVMDDEGRVWVERFQARPEADARWLVFDGEGELIARVTLPPPDRFDLHAVSDGAVVGVTRDELDVEYVVRYPMVKTHE